MVIARCAIVLMAAFALSACTRVVVHKDPGPHDRGIRYYRPKPYLLILPDGPAGGGKPLYTVNQGAALKVEPVLPTGGQSDPQSSKSAPAPQIVPASLPLGFAEQSPAPGSKVSISMTYLPDFAEEYSIQLRPGLGIGELNIKLDNGWNLTSVGMKTDQQTDEIIKSTADLVSSIGGALKGGPEAFTTDGKPICRILATNIPFGFYEAVIACDPHGRKQLYGWRYVGFMPFQACPVQAGGLANVCCDDPDAIYGLVIDKDGIMRFEKIGSIPHMPTAVRN